MALVGAGPGTGVAQPAAPGADASVVTAWNETAVATILTDARRVSPEAFLYYAFTQAAVHNAVNGITRRYELYRWDARGPVTASPAAAAATAAHDVLLHYFPASRPRLDAALERSLAGVPDGVAEQQGVRYGAQAAQRIIALRADDGRDAPVSTDLPPDAGVWRPTPPAHAPFLAAWLSGVQPLLLDSPSQLRPPPPPALPSAQYAAELDEVKALGAKEGSTRTALQTQTARFVSDTPIAAVQGALRDLATRRGMDISDSARLFALVDCALADTIISVWESKLHYGRWRPLHAIRLAADDGNDATSPVNGWESLINNPPYPDYAAGTPAVFSSTARSVSQLLGEGDVVDLRVTSVAAGAPGAPLVRHYGHAAQMVQDAVDGRVWGGVHFRSANEAGAAIGRSVSDLAVAGWFRPVEELVPARP